MDSERNEVIDDEIIDLVENLFKGSDPDEMYFFLDIIVGGLMSANQQNIQAVLTVLADVSAKTIVFIENECTTTNGDKLRTGQVLDMFITDVGGSIKRMRERSNNYPGASAAPGH